MIVAYAFGGGLGHLTRVRSALHTLGRTGPVTYLTSSPFAADRRVVGEADVRLVPAHLAADPAALRAFIRAQLHDLEPAEVVVDAFPFGIAGELDASVAPTGTRVTHLARLLRWDHYTAVARPPASALRFDRTLVVEPLGAAHGAALSELSVETSTLALIDPDPQDPAPPVAPGAWLVVHAGAIDEVRDLLAYARDQAAAESCRPEIVLVGAPAPVDELPVIDAYPAWPLFAAAGRVFTAAGFNAMRQLAPHRDRHRILPFARRFDDQFERARRARVEPTDMVKRSDAHIAPRGARHDR